MNGHTPIQLDWLASPHIQSVNVKGRSLGQRVNQSKWVEKHYEEGREGLVETYAQTSRKGLRVACGASRWAQERQETRWVPPSTYPGQHVIPLQLRARVLRTKLWSDRIELTRFLCYIWMNLTDSSWVDSDVSELGWTCIHSGLQFNFRANYRWQSSLMSCLS